MIPNYNNSSRPPYGLPLGINMLLGLYSVQLLGFLSPPERGQTTIIMAVH